VVHLARCATQVLYNTDTYDMNKSQSWSLPSLSFLSADLTWLGMYRLPDCLTRIPAFTGAKHDTTWKIDAFEFSIFWTCSLKTSTNDCKCHNVLKRVRSENFPKIVSEQQLIVDGHEVWMWSWVHLKHPWQARIKW